jgi:hypothetical protein
MTRGEVDGDDGGVRGVDVTVTAEARDRGGEG